MYIESTSEGQKEIAREISLTIGRTLHRTGMGYRTRKHRDASAEVGFNYTYFHGTTAQPTGFNQNGGSAYVEYNVNNVLGVVADFGGYANGRRASARDSGTTFGYLFGPRFNWRKSRFVPYAQVLFGGSGVGLNGPSGSVSRNGFTTAAGGGLDLVAVWASPRGYPFGSAEK